MNKRIIFLVAALVVVLGMLAMLFVSKLDADLEELEEAFELDFSKEKIILGRSESPIFLLSGSWGISGNHEVIIVSRDSLFETGREGDYNFFCDQIFYRTTEGDSLTIYAPAFSVVRPKSDKAELKVRLVELANRFEIDSLNTNYQIFELNKVSVE